MVTPLCRWFDGRDTSTAEEIGAASTDVNVRRFYFGRQTILGTTMGSPRDFASLLSMLDERPGWRPVVDSVRPFERAAEAHAAIERREHTGKLVLSIV